LIYGGFTLFEHKRNEEIWKELKVEPVDEKMRKYKSNWLTHITRINSKIKAKIMLDFRLNGQRRLG
jgi:hypothetical protein